MDLYDTIPMSEAPWGQVDPVPQAVVDEPLIFDMDLGTLAQVMGDMKAEPQPSPLENMIESGAYLAEVEAFLVPPGQILRQDDMAHAANYWPPLEEAGVTLFIDAENGKPTMIRLTEHSMLLTVTALGMTAVGYQKSPLGQLIDLHGPEWLLDQGNNRELVGRHMMEVFKLHYGPDLAQVEDPFAYDLTGWIVDGTSVRVDGVVIQFSVVPFGNFDLRKEG